MIYQNELMELIQHKPLIDQVQAEPILIVPAWIMKYYLLDSTAQNILVEYLTKQGFAVFVVTWKNPDLNEREWTMEDYRQLGVMDALDCITNTIGHTKVHGLGYFLGGTLLSIAAAAMAKNEDDRFKTLSFFASLVDFSETGERMHFEDESQMTFLENMMKQQQQSNAKTLADIAPQESSDDFAWSRMMRNYLMGELKQTNNQATLVTDIDTDTADMSYKIHSQFLRELIMKNDFAEGRYMVDNKPIAISDIKAPIFVADTERDHLATWHAVYNIHQLVNTDITFLLTKGGYYTQSDNEPREPNRSYQIGTAKKKGNYVDPESWAQAHSKKQGSWWPEFSKWLKNHSETSKANSAKARV